MDSWAAKDILGCVVVYTSKMRSCWAIVVVSRARLHEHACPHLGCSGSPTVNPFPIIFALFRYTTIFLFSTLLLPVSAE